MEVMPTFASFDGLRLNYTVWEGDGAHRPVLPFGEVMAHPHLIARGTIVERDGVPQAAPAPRFSRTPPTVPGPPADPEPVEQVLADWSR